jgi:hypothetical protein
MLLGAMVAAAAVQAAGPTTLEAQVGTVARIIRTDCDQKVGRIVENDGKAYWAASKKRIRATRDPAWLAGVDCVKGGAVIERYAMFVPVESKRVCTISTGIPEPLFCFDEVME